jgi:hypothetical protein
VILPKYETASRHNKSTRPTAASRKAAYAAVAVRSKGICEADGTAEAVAMHHRKYRSRGGEDTVSNLLHLCLEHHLQAHTAIGEQAGWSIRSGHKPERVPYFRKFDGTWWLLSEGGEPEAVHPTTAMEYMQLIGAIKTGLVA